MQINETVFQKIFVIIEEQFLGKTYPDLETQLAIIQDFRAEKFIPDYLAIRTLSMWTGINSRDIIIMLVGLANILRVMDENNIDELFVGPFRIVRFWIDELKKNLFVITAY